MAEEEKNKKTKNIFMAKSIFPEAAPIFTFHLRPVDEVKDDCIVVLDTNVLLAPYTIGKENLLDQCSKTYKPLIASKRLIIPGQTAREFAKNRTMKLAELNQQLSRKKQVPQMQKGKYPLLSSINAYQDVLRLEEEIDKKLREYQKAVDEILTHIQAWEWNDPVSLLYGELFTDDVVLDLTISEEEVVKDLDRRHEYGIPPGYKDQSKKDEGIGDLLIWDTILEIGKMHKKSVLFVSGEEKADWYQKSEGQPLYLRYELVDEFRRRSDGQSFHIVKFSRFLELYGASENIVKEVRQEEILQSNRSELLENSSFYRNNDLILPMIKEKLSAIYSIIKDEFLEKTNIGSVYLLIDQAGNNVAVSVIFSNMSGTWFDESEIIDHLSRCANLNISYDTFIHFIIMRDFTTLLSQERAFPRSRLTSLIDHSFVFGYLENTKLNIVRTVPIGLFGG